MVHSYSIEAVVCQAAASFACVDYCVVRIVWVNGVRVVDFEGYVGADGMPCKVVRPLTRRRKVGFGIFEIAVLDYLGIDATIGRVVDVLEKTSVEYWADGICLVGL